MDELPKLAERCEQATGPDRVLDGQIGVAIRFAYESIEGVELEADAETGAISVYAGKRKIKRFHAPLFTASLDAAMTLVPEAFAYKKGQDMDNGDCLFTLETDDLTKYGRAKTWPIALCAAALRARANPSLDGKQ